MNAPAVTWQVRQEINQDPIIESSSGALIATVFTASRAPLIAAAPELLAHVKAQHQAIDHLLAMLIDRDPEFRPTEWRLWETVARTPALVAKAGGKME